VYLKDHVAVNLLETAEGLKGVNFPDLVTLALGTLIRDKENNKIKNIRGLVGLNFKNLEILNLCKHPYKPREQQDRSH